MEEFTPSEKLILYLDGELPQDQELDLFSRFLLQVQT
jgi:hypothetical protein